MTLTVGSLFSGIGGFELGLERAGMRCIWQSEIDPYASAVLRKHWPEVPNHGDIRNIRAGHVERPDVICGGFPCQPFSHAGKQAAQLDDRHLWPEMCRVVDELDPAWVVGENVVGLINLALDDVLTDLESIGYEALPFVIPASAVDAKHRRERVFIVAHANSARLERRQREVLRQCSGEFVAGPRGALPDSDGKSKHAVPIDAKVGGAQGPGGRARWLPEPNVGRVAHGVPSRVDRLRCLGNAIVPQVAEVIGRAVMRAAA